MGKGVFNEFLIIIIIIYYLFPQKSRFYFMGSDMIPTLPFIPERAGNWVLAT